jgi:hypothetical protein
MPTASLAESLAQFNAELVGGGITSRGPVSFWVDEDGDWVIVLTPNNTSLSCILADGIDYAKGKEAPPRVEKKPPLGPTL